MACKNGFWVKLNGSKRKCFVLHSHDYSVISNGRGLQLFWQSFLGTVQGMISSDLRENEWLALLVVLSRDDVHDIPLYPHTRTPSMGMSFTALMDVPQRYQEAN